MKKKVIKIAHLYYDLMNLYGESGNVKALKKFIERQGCEAEIHFLTLGDEIDFEAYDFYYMGCGTEHSEELVIRDLEKYRRDIINAIDDNKMFLITGNAMEIFGKKIRYQNGKSKKCLGIFEYEAVEQKNILISEIYYKYDKFPKEEGRFILGFKNCTCNILHNSERMFGFPNNFNRNNFYTMNFIGPFLVRNPYFTNMLVEKLFKQKGYEYTPITNTIEFTAYHKFVENFNLYDILDEE